MFHYVLVLLVVEGVIDGQCVFVISIGLGLDVVWRLYN